MCSSSMRWVPVLNVCMASCSFGAGGPNFGGGQSFVEVSAGSLAEQDLSNGNPSLLTADSAITRPPHDRNLSCSANSSHPNMGKKSCSQCAEAAADSPQACNVEIAWLMLGCRADCHG